MRGHHGELHGARSWTAPRSLQNTPAPRPVLQALHLVTLQQPRLEAESQPPFRGYAWRLGFAEPRRLQGHPAGVCKEASLFGTHSRMRRAAVTATRLGPLSCHISRLALGKQFDICKPQFLTGEMRIISANPPGFSEVSVMTGEPWVRGEAASIH